MSFATDLVEMAKQGGLNKGHYLTDEELVIEWHRGIYRYHIRAVLNTNSNHSTRMESLNWLLDETDDPTTPFTISSYAYLASVPLIELHESIKDILRTNGIFRMLSEQAKAPTAIKTARAVGLVLKYDEKSRDRYKQALVRKKGIDPSRAQAVVTQTINKEKKLAEAGQFDLFEQERSKMGLTKQSAAKAHINATTTKESEPKSKKSKSKKAKVKTEAKDNPNYIDQITLFDEESFNFSGPSKPASENAKKGDTL